MRADHEQVSRLIRTARGQLEGILKMIEEDRYCIDISNQLLASISVLRKANREILRAHMKGCVAEALESENADAKLDEVLDLLDKISK